MKRENQKIIFGKRVRVYEPENLKSPRAFYEEDKMRKSEKNLTSLLSSSDTYHKKVPKQFTGFTSKRKTVPKKLPNKWRLRKFGERSKTEIGDSASKEHLMSMETKKRSLRNRTHTLHPRNPFASKPKAKLAISDIIDPKPVEKHQLWISSLTRNRKASQATTAVNPYLNMSSFNISDDISHIIPSFSSKMNANSSRRRTKEGDSRKESTISQSNFMKNNQSISAIEPDNLSYRFIHKDDPHSFLGEIAPEMDFHINLYENSAGGSTTSKTFTKGPRLQTRKGPRVNSSCNTLQYNPSEFTKRIMSHKKNNPSLDVQGGQNSRHFSHPNHELPGRTKSRLPRNGGTAQQSSQLVQAVGVLLKP